MRQLCTDKFLFNLEVELSLILFIIHHYMVENKCLSLLSETGFEFTIYVRNNWLLRPRPAENVNVV